MGRKFCYLTSLLMIALCLPSGGQTGNGSIQGTVRDPSGAVVPAAQVTAEHVATSRRSTTTTNQTGFYLFPSLPPGTYTVTVEAKGLQSWRGDLLLQTGQAAVIDVQLQIGSTAAEITVTADVTPLLTTTQPTLAEVVERQRIDQLPLNGRFFQNLIVLTTPGIEGSASNARVYGLRSGSMEYIQDGATLNQRNLGQLAARPPGIDTINEFRVETSVSSAKYNRPASTIVSTKSGSNEIHGAVFHTMRNNGFGVARRRQDFYEKPPQLIRNEFGASLGGPVWLPKLYNGRNRTFIFAAWEDFRLRQGTTISTAMRPWKCVREIFPDSITAPGSGSRCMIPGRRARPRPGNASPFRTTSFRCVCAVRWQLTFTA